MATRKKQMGIDFKIKKFDMNMIGDNKIIIFMGKRGTGKSTLVLDYLYHNSDLPLGTVVSPTDEYNHTYKPHIPSIFIHDEYTPELIDKFVRRQKMVVKSTLNDREYSNVDPRAFLIFDDCLYDQSAWVNDKNIKWIFMNGRHGKITFILTMQYMLGIPPGLRTQVDYLFICKETKIINKKKLYEQYAGMFPNFDMFNTVLTECTKDQGCLVIDNSSNSDNLEDQVFWYKADLHNNFRMCYDQFWKNNDAVEDDEDEEEHNNNYDNRIKSNKADYNILRQHQSNSSIYS